jgi:Protein of unknown function (DUF1592)/Protein of unknown function (DUF1588)/Protein of unknown function (DUF1585)/Protein of unknown function (DUF1595)/Protein of unknown function (DUF1587)
MKQINATLRCQLAVMLAPVILTACTAEIGGPGPGQVAAAGTSSGGAGTGPGAGTTTPPITVDGETVTFAPAPGSFKRLTSSELKNSLKALLGPVTMRDVEPDTFLGGFAKVGGSTVSVSLNGVGQYQAAIEAATAEVFADAKRRDAFVGCVPQSVTDSACFKTFIQRFGRLAWRQALTPAQLERETALASSLAQTFGNATDALRATTNALLQSPNFLYRLERGEPDGAAGLWRFTASEMASRLSYFLTNSAPDAALLDAAEQGKLTTADGVRGEAQRLTAGGAGTPGRESVRNFASELFRLEIVSARAKDPSFVAYTPSLQQAMVQEVPSMLEDLVFEQAAPATNIFTTRTTYVNSDLAKLYGLDASGLTVDSWVKVSLPANGLRAGYLGTGAFLSEFANQKEGSPTQRGKFIRTALLCQAIPDPPPNVSTNLTDGPAGVHQTRREKLAVHRQQGATCNGCHALMDPLGLPLENFDAIGAYRETDGGLPIDVSGDLDGAAFNGPTELGTLLSQNDQVASCLIRNLYRYATGVLEAKQQEPAIGQLATQFKANGKDLRKLMVELVASDGFRLVAPAL